MKSAINSVLQQTFDNYEIIVVDDNSTDDTLTAVHQINDSRIQIHSHVRNKGGSAARNTGIEQASGEYIAFLDSDDEWLPSKLEKQVNCLKSRSDEWIGVYCDYEVQRHGFAKMLRKVLHMLVESNQTKTRKREGGEGLIGELLSNQFSTGGASTLLVTSEAVERINGFDPKFRRHQDWEFLIRFLSVGSLAYVDEKLVTKHETSSPSAATIEDSKKKYFNKFREEIYCAEQSGYDVTAKHRFDLACWFFRDGNFHKGLHYLKMVSSENQELFPLVRSMLHGLRMHAYTGKNN